MLFYTMGQGYLFAAMVLTGVALGLVYDFIWLWRRALMTGPLLTLLLDCAFGVGAAALCYGVLWLTDYGEVRVYALLGVLLGALGYALALSPLLRGVAVRAVRYVSRAATWLGRRKLIRRIFR